jgi:hypothetical protein
MVWRQGCWHGWSRAERERASCKTNGSALPQARQEPYTDKPATMWRAKAPKTLFRWKRMLVTACPICGNGKALR